MMKGIDFAEVRDAIMNAFRPDEFDMLLFERLKYEREMIVADGPFKTVVTNVLRDFERQGLEPILIQEVAARRPLKKDIQDVYRKYARAMVDDTRRSVVDVNRAAAIARYGLIRDVAIQVEGVSTQEIKSTAGAGLEKAITDLGFINYYAWLRQMLRLEGQVCRVEIDGTPVGTGFLVGPDLMLTNYHVIVNVASRADGTAVVARFDLHQTSNGPSSGTPVTALPVDWLKASGFYTPEELAGRPDDSVPDATQLDFALIQLSKPIGREPLHADILGSSPRGWISLPAAAPAIGVDMPLMILQHPKTMPLKLALDTKSVIGLSAGGRRVRYRTNTENGSSGSPCFDIHGQIVALHHYGDPAWPNGAPRYNQGVPIITIVDRLNALGLGALVTPRIIIDLEANVDGNAPGAALPVPAAGIPPELVTPVESTEANPLDLHRLADEDRRIVRRFSVDTLWERLRIWITSHSKPVVTIIVFAVIAVIMCLRLIPPPQPLHVKLRIVYQNNGQPGEPVQDNTKVVFQAEANNYQSEAITSSGLVSFEIDSSRRDDEFLVTLPSLPGFSQNYRFLEDTTQINVPRPPSLPISDYIRAGDEKARQADEAADDAARAILQSQAADSYRQALALDANFLLAYPPLIRVISKSSDNGSFDSELEKGLALAFDSKNKEQVVARSSLLLTRALNRKPPGELTSALEDAKEASRLLQPFVEGAGADKEAIDLHQNAEGKIIHLEERIGGIKQSIADRLREGRTLAAKGDFTGARAEFEDAVNNAEAISDSVSAGTALWEIGKALASGSERDLAESQLSAAIKKLEKDSPILAARARCDLARLRLDLLGPPDRSTGDFRDRLMKTMSRLQVGVDDLSPALSVAMDEANQGANPDLALSATTCALLSRLGIGQIDGGGVRSLSDSSIFALAAAADSLRGIAPRESSDSTAQSEIQHLVDEVRERAKNGLPEPWTTRHFQDLESATRVDKEVWRKVVDNVRK